MTTPSRRPEVLTRSGSARGVWREHRSVDGEVSRAAVFLGIPYAEAPVGDRRFLAPVPRAAWDGVRDCALHGSTPQRRSPWADSFIPEPTVPGADTLTLDVGTPDPRAGAGLPVLVYIHGGGFVGGSPASPWYGGQAFQRDGVVTVTFGYRLGFDGFGWIDGAPLNRAVLDQLAALRWVQENISAFGGDPSRVTIAGQSAGGASVMRLLTMPAAQGLFRGAIALSPADVRVTVDDARAFGTRVAGTLGVAPDLAGMRSRSEIEVLDAQGATFLDGPPGEDALAGLLDDNLRLSPVIDGGLIPGTIAEGIAAGVGADVALLIGSTAHEFNAVAAGMREALDGVEPTAALERAGISGPLAAELAARVEGGDAADVVGQALSDAMFRRHVARWASLRAAGEAASRTWAYDFRWSIPELGQAPHCADLPFGFDILRDREAIRRVGLAAPQALADAVHGDWLRVVVDGTVDAPPHADGTATIVYGDPVRGVEAGYAFERAFAAETLPG
ncbi:carboxylesterase/lipase family protein [Demequina lignilytica]|uniref:Carboxylic ester hydrolase n=1 Tax=Demequina lignilytica TaxID=3051663 RepID=A0AAW7M6I5_9MICO|nr:MULTISPECIES: carboxylesterase family protein [unclassified Demequina]MDN4479235.1 carboxylesterase family protein [Demequina sp. SYSU T00039-1]MDN4484461.1 carboxylesterase family protein [Demequina sp. SYSU T0a273]MDN4487906.1 carboxylesterase family protein [Demequina sp. SYSU T00039]